MIKVLILYFLCIIISFTEADTVIASWGNPPPLGSPSNPASASYIFGGSSDSSSSGDSISLSEAMDRLFGRSSQSSYSYPSSSSNYNYYNYANRTPQPIYGSTGYTSGRINNYGSVQGQQNLNYNEYSYHYWRCINYYRGQYYYSYTFNGYVCDTRANRSG